MRRNCEPTAAGASVRELSSDRVLSMIELMLEVQPWWSGTATGNEPRKGRQQ